MGKAPPPALPPTSQKMEPLGPSPRPPAATPVGGAPIPGPSLTAGHGPPGVLVLSGGLQASQQAWSRTASLEPPPGVVTPSPPVKPLPAQPPKTRAPHDTTPAAVAAVAPPCHSSQAHDPALGTVPHKAPPPGYEHHPPPMGPTETVCMLQPPRPEAPAMGEGPEPPSGHPPDFAETRGDGAGGVGVCRKRFLLQKPQQWQ